MRRPIVSSLLVLGGLAAAAGAQDEPATSRVAFAAASIEAGRPTSLPAGLDVARCDRIELSVRPTKDRGWLRVQFDEAHRPSHWFRADRAPAGKWTQLSFPLRWFRAGGVGTPRWEDVRMITLTAEAPMQVRDLRLVEGSGPHAAYPGPEQLREIAFPTSRHGRVALAGGFALLTDDADLRAGPVLAELRSMRRRLLADFPAPYRVERPVPLLVFAGHEAYAAFWLRYLQLCGYERPPRVAHSGFSMVGFATTWRHEDATGPRPRYVHEAVHALLAIAHGIANDGSWVQEGLAEHEAWCAAGARRPLATIYAGVADADARRPFASLLGEFSQPARYWQVGLVTEWLRADPGRLAGLRGLLEDLRTTGRALRRANVEARFRARLPVLEKRWLQAMRERYPAEDD